MIKSLREGRAFEILLLGWLLTLPFGAKIGSLALGPITVYPNFIFALILLAFSIFHVRKWSKAFVITTGFLFLWLVSAMVYGATLGFENDVVFDIRSLLMQLFFAIILYSGYTALGQDKFKRVVVIGLRCFLIVLLLFGLFEFYTGNHLVGTTTDKFENLIVGAVFYAPTFLYDNPNDYMLYAMFILMALIIVDRHLRLKPFAIISMALLLLIFNLCSLSRLAFVFLTLIVLIQLGVVLWKNQRSITLNQMLPLMFSFLGVILLTTINPIFLGPKYQSANPYQYNDLRVVKMEGDSITEIVAFQYLEDEEQEQIRTFKESSTVHYVRGEDVVKMVSREKEFTDKEAIKIEEAIPADQVRVNLIKNGVEFIKSNPILGIGPGQFRAMHKANKSPNPTGTVTSPHNFVIEATSQYGIFGWGYFGLLVFLFVKFLREWKKRDKILSISLFTLFVALPVFWMMPSSYLYLDINWLLLPLLVIVLFNYRTEKDGQ